MNKQISRFKQFVQTIKPQIQQTNVEAVKQALSVNESFYLIDVREESEWKKGHLPNAIHLSKGRLECDIDEVVADSDAKIVLYCGGGSRSAIAAYNLQQMGYQSVFSMDGGFRDWQQAGYQIIP